MKLEERLQVRVSKKMLEELRKEADRRGVKVSDVVRMTLSNLTTSIETAEGPNLHVGSLQPDMQEAIREALEKRGR